LYEPINVPSAREKKRETEKGWKRTWILDEDWKEGESSGNLAENTRSPTKRTEKEEGGWDEQQQEQLHKLPSFPFDPSSSSSHFMAFF
jgi:hypothetical protein